MGGLSEGEEMVGGTVILKCSRKRWEKAHHSFSESKDTKRLKEFSKWTLDSDIDLETEWIEGEDCLKIDWCADTDLKGCQEIVKGFQRYLEAFGEVECASGGKGQTLNKIFMRCLREINRNY